MKHIAASTLLAFAAAFPTVSFAQFSMPSIPGISKSPTNTGAQADLGGQQTALVRNFVGANKDVLAANAKMADALGLKNQANEAQASADALTDGATKGNLESSNKMVSDTGGAVSAAMEKKPVLDAQAKTTFSLGLVSLASGATKYAGMGMGVKQMSSSISSASPMELPKLQPAAYIVSNFPGSASNVTKALKNAIDFARNNGIEVPPTANDAMSALGSMKS
jgi:hypothetical protein